MQRCMASRVPRCGVSRAVCGYSALLARNIVARAELVVALAAHDRALDAGFLGAEFWVPRRNAVEADRIRTLVVPAAEHVPSLPSAFQEVRADRGGGAPSME